MSELKPYIGPHPIDHTLTEYYLKSEVDKVIALLTDKANYNEYAYKHKSEEFADTCRFYEDELHHQKYKRCLAMAKRCEIGAQFQHNNAMQFDNPFHIKRAEWLEKWKKRWLKLAEKFKEG